MLDLLELKIKIGSEWLDFDRELGKIEELQNTDDFEIESYYQELLSNLSIQELIKVWNNWDEIIQEAITEAEIFDMDYFDEILQYIEPSRIALSIHHGDFNPYSRYFTFDAYGNLKSLYSYKEVYEYAKSYIEDRINVYI